MVCEFVLDCKIWSWILESKVKHCVWDELIIYAKAVWEHVIKQIRINNFFIAAMLQGFAPN